MEGLVSRCEVIRVTFGGVCSSSLWSGWETNRTSLHCVSPQWLLLMMVHHQSCT